MWGTWTDAGGLAGLMDGMCLGWPREGCWARAGSGTQAPLRGGCGMPPRPQAGPYDCPVASCSKSPPHRLSMCRGRQVAVNMCLLVPRGLAGLSGWEDRSGPRGSAHLASSQVAAAPTLADKFTCRRDLGRGRQLALLLSNSSSLHLLRGLRGGRQGWPGFHAHAVLLHHGHCFLPGALCPGSRSPSGRPAGQGTGGLPQPWHLAFLSRLSTLCQLAKDLDNLSQNF